MVEKFYTGIGSRETPDDILDMMRRLGATLGRLGWTLRSGGAKGADTAFEEGARAVQGARRIYLPKEGFGPLPRKGDTMSVVPETAFGRSLWDMACEIAEPLHPVYARLDVDTRRKLTRNVFQVLGDSLRQPSTMVVCYGTGPAFDSQQRCVDVKGGTGLAVRLAAEYRVPVYNLFLPEHQDRIERFLEQQTQALLASDSRSAARRPSAR